MGTTRRVPGKRASTGGIGAGKGRRVVSTTVARHHAKGSGTGHFDFGGRVPGNNGSGSGRFGGGGSAKATKDELISAPGPIGAGGTSSGVGGTIAKNPSGKRRRDRRLRRTSQ